MAYIKYKTTICRHWEETQTCSLGDACSFAHGEHEKRGMNDVSGYIFDYICLRFDICPNHLPT